MIRTWFLANVFGVNIEELLKNFPLNWFGGNFIFFFS